MKEFDPESAVPEVISDEYSNLLKAATQRALESEAVRSLTAKFEKRISELEKECEEYVAKMQAEHKKMQKTCDELESTLKEHEKRIHQVASRPLPKDNSGTVVEAFKEGNKEICEALMKSNAEIAKSVAATLEMLSAEDEDEEEDDEEDESETPAPVAPPARRPYRFNINYDDNNRPNSVDAIPVD